MAMGTAPLLISVVKSNKYALLGVLGFDAKGGHITYENTYHSAPPELLSKGFQLCVQNEKPITILHARPTWLVKVCS